jgi:hypothetical protein
MIIVSPVRMSNGLEAGFQCPFYFIEWHRSARHDSLSVGAILRAVTGQGLCQTAVVPGSIPA